MTKLWIWLRQRPGLSNREKKVLLSRFGSVEKLYASALEDLSPMGLSEKAMAGLLDKNLTAAQGICDRCAQLGIGILTYTDPGYPQALRAIGDSPLVLYWQGTLPDWSSFTAVGIVGTRKASAHAQQNARYMARELCQGGVAIVSGMAAGIDAWATTGALEVGGVAVGVLGCGIDLEYPASNHNLYTKMRWQGCLISEYPPGMRAQQWTFPERNRIISGLSSATLVVEAPQRSGALITAADAKKQGKLLFAMPGPEGYLCCAGSNELLTQGAIRAEKAQDILQHLPGFDKKRLDKTAPISYSVASEEVSAQALCILQVLESGPMTVDEVIVKSSLSSPRALMEITRLEMMGRIYRPDPLRVALKNT